MKNKVSIQNKRAKFNFELLDNYIAGIQLLGSEVKSIRENNANITECFCFFKEKELFIKNMYISEYKESNINNHNPTRDRKLLLTKKELTKISKSINEKGMTLIPVLLFENDNGLIKLKISLGKGKNKSDKRNSLKESDTKREMDKEKKEFNKYG